MLENIEMLSMALKFQPRLNVIVVERARRKCVKKMGVVLGNIMCTL